ncbi:ABC transporter substrate-binding protein [Rhizobium oryzicola]|uniref:ABC transporter substrate-binding protein n=1 Tax=Rhizobium oryzicola TaxID=1232668 RepID=A0ABT8SZB9_9HYPH|nr:ABC transporter substrate-binding protein [Rhizobium oryzicola]MDO1583238.1 ABC transporter substrate-binding protein [Rhizobium oryzicola]
MKNLGSIHPLLARTTSDLDRRQFLKRGARAVAATAAMSSFPVGLVSRARAADSTIVVGFITSMSGPVSSLGIPYDQGIKAALAFKNQVGGKSVKLIALDDASDPTIAAVNARKLIQESNVDVIIGTAGSPGALAIATVCAETKTPLICIANANPQGEPGNWTITIPQPAPLMIAGAVAHMQQAGVKSVGYMGFADPWGDLVYNALMESTPAAGIKVTSNERYARADTSVTGQALKVFATRPDVFVGGGSGTPGALPYLALRERGYKGQFYGTPAIINPAFVKVGGAAVEGLIASTGPVVVFEQLADTNPTKAVSQEFAKALKATVPDATPNAFSGYSFDAWVLFLAAAENAIKTNAPGTPQFKLALRDALTNAREVVGSHGVYNFKPGSRYGNDERSRVLVKLEKSDWKLIS